MSYAFWYPISSNHSVGLQTPAVADYHGEHPVTEEEAHQRACDCIRKESNSVRGNCC
jgi:hypothetical protein